MIRLGNFHWPRATSASRCDHYQQDGFKEVPRIQPENMLICLLLLLVFISALGSLFFGDDEAIP